MMIHNFTFQKGFLTYLSLYCCTFNSCTHKYIFMDGASNAKYTCSPELMQ